jgi:HPt (histidine-containing phosphotransfer) domain-containing protein
MIASDAAELDDSLFATLVAELGLDDTLQMFSVFFDETDKRLSRLRELPPDNWGAIEQEAHGLKGSAGNFGLRKVAELAAELEHGARTLTSGSYEAALRGLETSYAAARQQFAKSSS